MTRITLPIPVSPPYPLTKDESDPYLDEIDDITRTTSATQNRRQVNSNGTQQHGRNSSPHGVAGNTSLGLLPQTDFDLQEMNNGDFMDSSIGGNSTV
jgi:hypothetical protein